ncbi:hypothetical protein RJP21_12485 [Paenibacillus sp. VCA1]|uniref:hypothetical protein n=1 Tax=Paenibacillus sp. VCA1 TaxID=3039148 RepID=UPI0028729D85|nr:hypothetical protein [Paenibacillus sp. VCA1]MDR9854421.1 hypothetical protein [Paenibacillus sp. VCA1]
MKPFVKLALTALSLAISLCLFDPRSAEAAASMQWSSSQQNAVDRAVASDAGLRVQLSTLYRTFTDLQEQLRKADQEINALHYKNEEIKSNLTKQIKLIDADKIAKLEAAAKQAKDKYKPLFSMYTSLNQQIQTASKLKNKQLSSALKTQADTMKVAVQIAKADIKNKEQALAAAKTKRTAAQKKIRGIMASADPLRIRIKAEKSTASSLNKNVSPMWRNVTQSVKGGNGKQIYNTLNTLVSQLRQVQAQKQKILSLENQIGGILQNAKSQLASVS